MDSPEFHFGVDLSGKSHYAIGVSGHSGQYDEDMVMMKLIVLGTKFSPLAVYTQPQISKTSLCQMAISVRCHAVRDVITKSNEIVSTRSMGSSAMGKPQRLSGGLFSIFN